MPRRHPASKRSNQSIDVPQPMPRCSASGSTRSRQRLLTTNSGPDSTKLVAPHTRHARPPRDGVAEVCAAGAGRLRKVELGRFANLDEPHEVSSAKAKIVV